MASTLKVDILQDSGGNNLVTSNGSGVITAAGFGKIGQVVHANLSAVTVSTSTATSCGSASITPSSTSSKILVFCRTVLHANNATAAEYYDVRVTLSSASGTLLSRLNDASLYQVDKTGRRDSSSTSFIHSPASTSQQTYHLTAARNGGTGNTIVNQNSAGDFVLMEILP